MNTNLSQPHGERLSDSLSANSSGQKNNRARTKQKSISSHAHRITQLKNDVIQTLNISMEDLECWLIQMGPMPDATLKQLLILAERYALNPLLGQIAIECNTAQEWHVYISIDGWIDVIWRQEKCTGITFAEAPNYEDGIPIWMECSIYRSDLQLPISVREYFIEVRTDHPAWIQMPRRMLRHKTLQQCARLAFGISENVRGGSQSLKANYPTPSHFFQEKQKDSPKVFLKERLQNLYNQNIDSL